jgi:electron transfer flavoprotein beta subunit
VKRLSAKGYDLIEAPMPAVISCTQALGAPRYPSLKGIMAARQREIAVRALADVGMEAGAALAGPWATRVIAADPPPARAKGRVVKGAAADAAREIADFLADRRLI